MTIEIPDECECEDDFVCTKCVWNTACVITELSQHFSKVGKEVE